MNANINRDRFAALVRGLRDDLKLTQQDLADNTGIQLRIIQDVEQGRRTDLHKDNLLLNLAKGLELTTLETQQFLFAESSVALQDFLPKNTTQPPKSYIPEKIIRELKQSVTNLRVPAFVSDSYCDILLAVHSLKFF
jgi:transcriptional regulator with XRE-family HTH domain